MITPCDECLNPRAVEKAVLAFDVRVAVCDAVLSTMMDLYVSSSEDDVKNGEPAITKPVENGVARKLFQLLDAKKAAAAEAETATNMNCTQPDYCPKAIYLWSAVVKLEAAYTDI